MKKTKKIMSLALALVMLLTVIVGSVSVFAQKDEFSEFNDAGWRIKGKVFLNNSLKNEGKEEVEAGKTYYKGTIKGEVEASDLFAGAYNKYVKDYKGHLYLGKPVENLVMFNKDEKFPTADVTVTFPADFKIDYNAIKLQSNTSLVSKIEIEDLETENSQNEKSFKLRFYLGNWNDYKGFFAMYEKEQNKMDHKITVEIPYSVEIEDDAKTDLGTISAEGVCALYKGGNWLFNTQLVDIKMPKVEFSVNR